MKKTRLLILVLCLSGFSVFQMDAQVTTATLNGVVMDEKGEALPGATVSAVHEPTGTQYGISVRPDGKFTLPNLRVGGPYTIEGRFVGYKSQKYTNISLSLGQKLTLNFKLEPDVTALEDVVVLATPPNDKSGVTTNINNEQLVILPTISRSAGDIYRLNPTASGNSFGGRNDQFNNFSLDGSIFNNPFGLDAATPGGQTNAQPISLDAIDQIQVNVAPFDVTQSGFTGASVNAVTKSGTNEFHGTVFGFYRNDGMTGGKVDGTDIIVPDLSQFQTGFSIGGPIIKNKLFFFANAEIERREDAGSNFIANSGSNTGENVSRVLVSDLNRVSNALRNRFGYETGVFEGYTHDTDNIKGIVKLDWNINEKHSLTATYNFLDASRGLPAHPNAITRRGPDLTTLQFQNSGYTINNKINSGIVELKSIFSNKTSNKFQIGYTAFRDSRDPFSTPFPVVNIFKDGIPYIIAGHEPFSINNVLDQDVFQLTNNFNLYVNDHAFTFGGSFERFAFNNSFNLTGYGFDVFGGYNSVDDFVNFVEAGNLDPTVQAAGDAFAAGNWSLSEVNLGQLSLYAQDEWSATNKLKLMIGLRIDFPLYFDTEEKIQDVIDAKGGLLADGGTYDPSIEYFDEDGNSTFFDHTELPTTAPLFSPRLGFTYDVNEDNSMVIRGGSGIFTGRFPFVWISNHVSNPDFFFYTVTDPDFKFPQVWRNNIGVDKELGEGWQVSADLIYTKDINSMMVRNFGLRLPGGNLNGVDNRPVYRSQQDRTLVFGDPSNAYVFTNTNEGKSFNATIQLKRNWKNGLYTTLAYNFLDSKDASSIEAEISSDAYDRNPALGHVNRAQLSPSLYGNRHRIVGTINKKFEYNGGKMATTFSLFFEYAQGGRFSYTYSGDINGDGAFNNDLLYVPTDGEIDAMTFSGDASAQTAQRNALRSFIGQDEYLSDRRGEYAEKYDILSPWYSSWDLRILQDLYMNGKQNKIQFSIDILNVGNLISSSWGVRQNPQNIQPIGVSVTEEADGNFTPVYSFDTGLNNTFANDFSLLSRWQLQIGLRYSF